MRHHKSGVKLGRTGSHRNAMFRNMVTSLLKHERIRTTDAKAKELRRWADHIITLAKRGDLHARRQALAIVREKEVVHKLFAEAAEKFGSREGGYTRLTKLGRRPGDAAPITLVELVSFSSQPKKKKKAKATPHKEAPATSAAETEGKGEPTVSSRETESPKPVSGDEDASAAPEEKMDAQTRTDVKEESTEEPPQAAGSETEEKASDSEEDASGDSSGSDDEEKKPETEE